MTLWISEIHRRKVYPLDRLGLAIRSGYNYLMFSDPKANVAALGLVGGLAVADFGAGSGAYALELARRVGGRGKVYAIDVQKELLERLSREAGAAHLPNVRVIWGNVERSGGSTLAAGSVDLVLVANLLFQSEARYSVALEAKRIFRPGGRAAVIDWVDSSSGIGPVPSHLVKADEVKRIFAEAGFKYERDFPAGPHHYGLIFKIG